MVPPGFVQWSGDAGDSEAPVFEHADKLEMGTFVRNDRRVVPGIVLTADGGAELAFTSGPFSMLRRARELMDLALQEIDLMIDASADDPLEQPFAAIMADGRGWPVETNRDMILLLKQAALGLVKSPEIDFPDAL